MILRQKLGSNLLLSYPKKLKPPTKQRSNLLSCRMGINYDRNTIAFQRKQIQALLQEHIPTNKLSRRNYLKELANSQITVSPFGLGEITLKDFEVFLSGSMLLKPDMSHMETWPNFFQDNETMLTHKWDLSDLEEKINNIQEDKEQIERIASNGQLLYKHYIQDHAGKEEFCNRFIKMVKHA